MQLTPHDKSMLAGEEGPALQMAMRILTTMAAVYGAERLLDISSAHIDGCLYHGYSGLEFAQRLVEGGARVRVPTTLNVGAIDLVHPEYFRGDEETGHYARELMAAYEAMGCQPIWTCAPYQTTQRPPFGAQIAWAESNAIVFANSVLGARTNRYGDFIDICAALTGRAPAVGLHLPENRRGQLLYRLQNVPQHLLNEDVLYPVLGYLLGSQSGSKIPVVEGLPAAATEDQLKALGAAAASSGAVALFHAIGVTPEARTFHDAFQGGQPEQTIDITMNDLRAALARLSTAPDGNIDVVALGSPHFSLHEFQQLIPLLQQHPPRSEVQFIVCTNRLALATLQKRGWLQILRDAGVQVVVDTCVVVTPIVRASEGVLMTNSGKFAHYTPGNIGLQVVFGSLEECVRSAEIGTVWRRAGDWRLEPEDGRIAMGEWPDMPGETNHLPIEGFRPLTPSSAHPHTATAPHPITAAALVLAEPLSLWGGLDPQTGEIIDRRHPSSGQNVRGRVLVLPAGRGSSSASSILLEAVRRGTAPAAILTAETDPILALGAAVARELYNTGPPILVLKPHDYAQIRDGDQVTISPGGIVKVM